MDPYEFNVSIKVIVDAYNEYDAIEVVKDILGEGYIGGVEVVDFRIKRN